MSPVSSNPKVKQGSAILITGASGFVGGNLALRAARHWRVYATYNHNPLDLAHAHEVLFLDVTNRESVLSAIRRISPIVVVHCAAITSVDYCADHAEVAWEVNVKGTEHVAVASKEINARLVYVSTDLVFDGASSLYRENDNPRPICTYGQTKLEGERIVASVNADSCIARAAWTYGRSVNKSQCFAERMIAKLRQGTHVQLFIDEYRSPIYINSLCDAILELARSCNTGVYQLAGPGRVSRLEFGLLAADVFRLAKSLISGISIEAFGGRDKRPRDCSMSNEKAAGTLSTPFLSISAGLRDMASHVPP